MLFPNSISSLNASAVLGCVFSAAKHVPRLIASASASHHAHGFVLLDVCVLLEALATV